MKRLTQRETNPFKYSDTNKRYHTYDYNLRNRFGGKCAKISLDAGFTCPNLDGTKGVGGCIYCSGGSSGAMCEGDIRAQYEAGVSAVRRKWECENFIPYLQAHTNTYADPETLLRIYSEAASLPGAVMLAIATRADCLSDGVLRVLEEVSKRIPLTVELGLQSANDKTAEIIGRGHTFEEFRRGFSDLRSIGGDISICTHIINGLPGESTEDMLETVEKLDEISIDVIKIHLLHVLKGTKLAEMYNSGTYTPMTKDEYISIVVSQLEILSPEVVVARITGDGISENLLAPEWSKRKTDVTNSIDKELFARNTYQGRLCKNK